MERSELTCDDVAMDGGLLLACPRTELELLGLRSAEPALYLDDRRWVVVVLEWWFLGRAVVWKT